MKLIKIEGRGNEHLYRHPVSQIIYVCKSKVGKKRLERSTRTDNTNEARLIRDDYLSEYLNKKKKSAGNKKLCGELIDQWLRRQEIKFTTTYKSYKNSVRHLRPSINSMLPEEITPSWWESEYIPFKRRNFGEKRKFFNERKVLLAFLGSLHEQGELAKLPELVNPDPKKSPGRVLSDDEISGLLEHAGPDLKLQINMALKMFMRLGEILQLKSDRIDQAKKVINLQASDTKIRKERSFAINRALWPQINSRLGDGRAYLFPSPVASDKSLGRSGNKRSWSTCKRKAKVKCRFHDLRHTALTKAFRTSTNPALICFTAGLSLETAQKVYLHFNVEDTRAVVECVNVSEKP